MLLEVLRNNIKKNSGWQYRKYIGLSQLNRGACIRYLYYIIMVNDMVRPGINGLFKCRDGYLFENDIIKQLEEGGVKVEDRGKEIVPEEFGGLVRGHIDGRINGYLLEIKTMIDEKYQHIVQNGIPNHIYDQVNNYMHYMKFEEAIILIKNITRGYYGEWRVRYNQSIAEMVIQKAQKVIRHIREKKLPERGFPPRSPICRNCLYQDKCEVGWNG